MRPQTSSSEALYVVPGDAIILRTNDERILGLADRLWERGAVGAPPPSRERAPVRLSVEVSLIDPAPLSREPLREDWSLRGDDAELSSGDGHIHVCINTAAAGCTGRVSAALVASRPSLVARLLLETPAAALLARRAYCVVHAGVVAGDAGAVVIRGPGGAGKSTLVAAAHRAGLRVLGDESVLVARDDPDELLAGVRDVTLLPDAVALVGVKDPVTEVSAGGDTKYRIDLFASSNPAMRHARRCAAVLLGPRTAGPARLEPLEPAAFLHGFEEGEIPQEQTFGTPGHIAEHWSLENAYRLSGTADLAGAVTLLARLA